MTVTPPDPNAPQEPGVLPTTLSIFDGNKMVPVEIEQPLNANVDMGGHTLTNLSPDHLVPPVTVSGHFLRSVDGVNAGEFDPSWAPVEIADIVDGTEIVRRDGSVAMTGNLDLGGGNKIVNLADSTAAQEAVTRAQLLAMRAEVDARIEQLVAGLAHAAAAIDYTNTPPTAPIPDTYYLVGDAPTGAWSAFADHIAHWDGIDWDFNMPRANESRLVESQAATFSWNGTSWVKIAQAGSVNAAQASLWCVGDIKQSSLTEPQFKTMLGPAEENKWVLADGRDVTGSDYATLTGNNNVPDLRGAYLRMAGQNNNQGWTGGALNTFQEDTTRMPRNAFVNSQDPGHRHGVNRILPQNWSVGWGRVADRVAMGINTSGGSGNDHTGNSNDPIFASGVHNHTITGGDTETRPKTYCVNVFIKVRN
jgi:hypothetical protein